MKYLKKKRTTKVNGFHMFLYKNKIVVTGGSGRFGVELQKVKNKYTVLYPNKKKLNILNFTNIKNYLKKYKPKYLVHLAGLSRPMDMHNKLVNKSIDLNIIGTANITKACWEMGIKLIYFSTCYLYPGTKGNYKETDPLLPNNKYAWSKLGGESAVHMYNNSLILRVSMTEKPFVHPGAFYDFKTNFIFHNEVTKILFKLINKRGIINLGGKSQTVYKFVKKFNPKIKKFYARKILGPNYPLNPSMNISKLKKILSK